MGTKCAAGFFLVFFAGASYVPEKPHPAASHFGPGFGGIMTRLVVFTVDVRPSSSVLRLKSGAIMSQSDASQASRNQAGGN